MKNIEEKPSDLDLDQCRERRLEAMHLQIIEGNPLDEEQVAMFEMFDRERWTDEQIKVHLAERAKVRAQR